MRSGVVVVAHPQPTRLGDLASIEWRECGDGLRVGALLRRDSPAGKRLPAYALRTRPEHGPTCPCCHVDAVCAHLREGLSSAETAGVGVERWLVDASGRADLVSIADRIVSDDILNSTLRFDGIVVVMSRVVALQDSVLEMQARVPEPQDHVGEMQCAVADRIIDRDENPGAGYCEAIDPRDLVGVPLYDATTQQYCPERWLPDDIRQPARSSLDDGTVDPALAALELPACGALAPDGLSDWLARVDSVLAGRSLRVKAIFNVRGFDAPVALHALDGRWQPPVWLRGAAVAPQRSRYSIVIRRAQPMSPPSTIRFVAVQ